MEKRYVNVKNNKCRKMLLNHIRKNDTVIVVDGSFMINARTKEHTSGSEFTKLTANSKSIAHELLMVTRINIPVETEYYHSDILGYHNNCEIQGFDGQKYYCSLINIVRYDC